MAKYRLLIRKIEQCEAIVEANSKEEAKEKFNRGEENDFENYSDSYDSATEYEIYDIEEIKEN